MYNTIATYKIALEWTEQPQIHLYNPLHPSFTIIFFCYTLQSVRETIKLKHNRYYISKTHPVWNWIKVEKLAVYQYCQVKRKLTEILRENISLEWPFWKVCLKGFSLIILISVYFLSSFLYFIISCCIQSCGQFFVLDSILKISSGFMISNFLSRISLFFDITFLQFW